MPAPSRVGVRLGFDSPYRGGTKRWHQLWHFTGPNFSGAGQFTTFRTALLAQITGLLPSDTHAVEAVGYDAGSSVPVFSDTFSIAGSSTASGGVVTPLEACALIRFTTTQRSTKNHPIYLFKWLRAVRGGGSGAAETLDSGLKTNISANMNTILAGLSDGTNSRQYCGPFGAVAQTRLVETYLHMREFPT